MKRMHIHLGVDNLDEGIRFYNTLFGTEPVKIESDYAKWLLDDPSINFAISTRVKPGLDHLGVQVEEKNELGELRERMKSADMSLFDEGEVVCCYARSDKSWVTDPAGIAWEAYQTMEDTRFFSDAQASGEAVCCVPDVGAQANCCAPSDSASSCCGG